MSVQRPTQIALLACLAWCADCFVHGVECPGSKRTIVSSINTNIQDVIAYDGNSELWPLTNLLSTNLDSYWCEHTFTPSSVGNYVNVTFTSPVVLDTFLSKGSTTGGSSEYVSNISVYFRSFEGGSLQFLKNFQLSSEDPLLLGVDEPFQAKMLHIVIHSAVASTGFYCWNLQLIGCLLLDATLHVPPAPLTMPTLKSTCYTAMVTTAKIVSSVNITTTSDYTKAKAVTATQPSIDASVASSLLTDASSCPGLLATAVALPIALVLLISAVVCVVSVLVLREKQKEGTGQDKSSHCDPWRVRKLTLTKVDNHELYEQSGDNDDDSDWRQRSSTITGIENNELYGQNLSNPYSNIYDNHEVVGSDSMEFNPQYCHANVSQQAGRVLVDTSKQVNSTSKYEEISPCQ